METQTCMEKPLNEKLKQLISLVWSRSKHFPLDMLTPKVSKFGAVEIYNVDHRNKFSR